jgi:hypothetical protein
MLPFSKMCKLTVEVTDKQRRFNKKKQLALKYKDGEASRKLLGGLLTKFEVL